MKKNLLLAISLGFTLGTCFAATKPATESSAGSQSVLGTFNKAVLVAEDFTTGDSFKLDAPLNDQSGGTGWQDAWSGHEAFTVSELEKRNRWEGDKLSFPAAVKATTVGSRLGNATLIIQRKLKAPIGKAAETWMEFYFLTSGRVTAGVGLVDSEGQLVVAASKDEGLHGESTGAKTTGFLRLFDAAGPISQNVSPREEKAIANGFRWNRVLMRIKGDGKGQAVAQAWVNPDQSSIISDPACTLVFAEKSNIAGVQIRAADFYDNVSGDIQIAGLTLKKIP